MNNPKDTGPEGQNQGQDSEERRQAAEQTWKDRQGVPRGTPEQGGKSADRIGGDGLWQPIPEVEDDDVEREGGGTVEKDEEGKKKV